MCWLKAKSVVHYETALIVSFLLWLTKCSWWPARFSIGKCDFTLNSSDRTAPVTTTWTRADGPEAVDGGHDGADSRSEVKCEVLYDPGPESTFMDVVFIHGLRGDKLKTWKQGVWKQVDQKPEPMVVRSTADGLSTEINRLEMLATDEEIKEFTNCWPRDWLPLDCPYVRVITISYSTDPYLWRPIWLRKPAR